MSDVDHTAGDAGSLVATPAASTPSSGMEDPSFVATARRLLPDSPVPAILGGSALALAGVIEWPVVAAIGVGYVALRRWHRSA